MQTGKLSAYYSVCPTEAVLDRRIAIFGPLAHWRYGIKEDDGLLELPSLIPWHNTTHDNASLDDLETLAGLVRAI